MSLNITILSPNHIYQSADYQVTAFATGVPVSSRMQKIFFVNCFKWNATVSFIGVAKFEEIDVGKWLADRVRAVAPRDTFDRLIEELLKAEEWLIRVPAPHNRHSFSVGAFINAKPVYTLISNFERPSGLADKKAALSLSVYQTRPSKTKTFVTGQKRAVDREMRSRLKALSRLNSDAQVMCSALAKVNYKVAESCHSVSKACFVSHLSPSGEGGIHTFDEENKPYMPPLGIQESVEKSIRKLVDSRFGPGRSRLISAAVTRSASSEKV